MQSFGNYTKGTIVEGEVLSLDVLGVIKTYNGSAPVEIESDHVTTMVPTMKQVDMIIDHLPYELDYEVMVHSIERDFDDSVIHTSSDAGDEQEDFEYDIDESDIDNESKVQYQLIIYTYNTSTEETIEEIKRRIKINSKGKRRIKMQCKKGFKFDGTKCVKISGGELVNKRKAIRRAVRTKRAKGSGFQKRIARLRNRAMKKRRGMGIRNFKK